MVDIVIVVAATNVHLSQEMVFTNISMETLKQAIDILNGDKTPTHRTQDFTIQELFPTIEGACMECGVQVLMQNRAPHVHWHNKLLP